MEASEKAASRKATEEEATLLQYDAARKLSADLESVVDSLRDQHKIRSVEVNDKAQSFKDSHSCKPSSLCTEVVVWLKTKIDIKKEKAAVMELELEIAEKCIEKEAQNVEVQRIKEISDQITEERSSLLEEIVAHIKAFECAKLEWRDKGVEVSKSSSSDIESLKTTIEKLNFELETERRNATRRISDAVKVAVEKFHKIRDPLYLAGVYIRSRRLEWTKPDYKQNNDLKELGHQASHYGMALQDASLYHGDCLYRRTDVDCYKTLYGVEPTFTLKHQECKRLLHILDWRGGMQGFWCPTNELRATFDAKFKYLLDRFGPETSTYIDFLENDADGERLYEILDVLYKHAKTKNTGHVSAKKNDRYDILSRI